MVSAVWAIALRAATPLLLVPLVEGLASARPPGLRPGVAVLEGLYLLALGLSVPGLAAHAAARRCAGGRPGGIAIGMWVPAVYLAGLAVPLACAAGGPGPWAVGLSLGGGLLVAAVLGESAGGWLERRSRAPARAAGALAAGWAVLAVVLVRIARPEAILVAYLPAGHRLPNEPEPIMATASQSPLEAVLPPPLLASTGALSIALIGLVAALALWLTGRAARHEHEILTPGTGSDGNQGQSGQTAGAPLTSVLTLAGCVLVVLVNAAYAPAGVSRLLRAYQTLTWEAALLAAIVMASWDMTVVGWRPDRPVLASSLVAAILWPRLAQLPPPEALGPLLTLAMASIAAPAAARACRARWGDRTGGGAYALAAACTGLLMLALDATHIKFCALGVTGELAVSLWVADLGARGLVLGAPSLVPAPEGTA